MNDEMQAQLEELTVKTFQNVIAEVVAGMKPLPLDQLREEIMWPGSDNPIDEAVTENTREAMELIQQLADIEEQMEDLDEAEEAIENDDCRGYGGLYVDEHGGPTQTHVSYASPSDLGYLQEVLESCHGFSGEQPSDLEEVPDPPSDLEQAVDELRAEQEAIKERLSRVEKNAEDFEIAVVEDIAETCAFIRGCDSQAAAKIQYLEEGLRIMANILLKMTAQERGAKKVLPVLTAEEIREMFRGSASKKEAPSPESVYERIIRERKESPNETRPMNFEKAILFEW